MAKWKYMRFDSRAFKFGDDEWDPNYRFETSWLLTPWMLFAMRALFCLYAFTVNFFIIGWEASGTHPGYSIHDVHKSFSFFTILTYWGLTFYFLVSSIHTLTYILTGKPLLARFPRPLQALHSLYYTTVTTFPFLVTVVYWGFLFSPFPTTFALWSNISQHGLNSFFALFEIFLTRADPQPWMHLFFLVILMGLYCGLAYITYATKHYFVYFFLNPNPKKIVDGKNVGGIGSGGVAAYVAGIAVAIIVVFLISRGAVMLRKFITEKKLGMQGKFVAQTQAQRDAEQDAETELESATSWTK